MALISTTYAKRSKDLENVDTTWLGNLIDSASAMIDAYCDRTIEAADHTETLDGTGQQWIYVGNPPINTLTSVIITDTDNTTETILSAQFRYDSDPGKIFFKHENTSTYLVFPQDFQNIQVAYNGGWSTIPDDLQQACIIITRNLYARSSVGKNAGLQSEKMGEASFARMPHNFEVMTPDAKMLLAKYRRLSFE